MSVAPCSSFLNDKYATVWPQRLCGVGGAKVGTSPIFFDFPNTTNQFGLGCLQEKQCDDWSRMGGVDPRLVTTMWEGRGVTSQADTILGRPKDPHTAEPKGDLPSHGTPG